MVGSCDDSMVQHAGGMDVGGRPLVARGRPAAAPGEGGGVLAGAAGGVHGSAARLYGDDDGGVDRRARAARAAVVAGGRVRVAPVRAAGGSDGAVVYAGHAMDSG